MNTVSHDNGVAVQRSLGTEVQAVERSNGDRTAAAHAEATRVASTISSQPAKFKMPCLGIVGDSDAAKQARARRDEAIAAEHTEVKAMARRHEHRRTAAPAATTRTRSARSSQSTTLKLPCLGIVGDSDAAKRARARRDKAIDRCVRESCSVSEVHTTAVVDTLFMRLCSFMDIGMEEFSKWVSMV